MNGKPLAGTESKSERKKKAEKGYAIRKRNGVSFSLSVFRIP